MFGWLKQRQLHEQKKLIYQNGAAANFLQGYFEQNNRIVALLKDFEEETQQIARSAYTSTYVTTDQLQRLLDINRELRRLYDQTATKHLESFDKLCTPLLGWARYYKMHQ